MAHMSQIIIQMRSNVHGQNFLDPDVQDTNKSGPNVSGTNSQWSKVTLKVSMVTMSQVRMHPTQLPQAQ